MGPWAGKPNSFGLNFNGFLNNSLKAILNNPLKNVKATGCNLPNLGIEKANIELGGYYNHLMLSKVT